MLISSSEILRRFPGLLILDGVNLNRVVFGIERKPKLKRTDEVRAVLQRSPFTFPIDVQAGFMDTELVKGFVMSFCGRLVSSFASQSSCSTRR
jgi:nuclear RNA export factor